MATLVERKELEEVVDLVVEDPWRQAAQPADKLQVFPSGKVVVQLGIFGDIAQCALVFDELLLNVESPIQNAALAGKQQAGEHLHGRALARSVGAKIAEHLARLNRETDFAYGGNAGVALG